jgi:hypothetical protein
MINLDAVALVGRANPEKPRTSPFSPIGSGVCVHPDGVVATCCHTLVNFLERWNPYGISKGPNVRDVIADAERYERPFFMFPSRYAWQNSPEAHEVGVYPMLSFQADRLQDVAVVELGGGRMDRPLPFVSIARNPPNVGDSVQYAGHFQGSETVFDPEGNVLGWSMSHETVSVVACRPEGFLIDYPVRPGMSGSGVCNSAGSLVGIICEYWPPELAAQRVGLKRPLGLAAYAQWLVPQYVVLRSEARARADSGELPWCGDSAPFSKS